MCSSRSSERAGPLVGSHHVCVDGFAGCRKEVAVRVIILENAFQTSLDPKPDFSMIFSGIPGVHLKLDSKPDFSMIFSWTHDARKPHS